MGRENRQIQHSVNALTKTSVFLLSIYMPAEGIPAIPASKSHRISDLNLKPMPFLLDIIHALCYVLSKTFKHLSSMNKTERIQQNEYIGHSSNYQIVLKVVPVTTILH